MPGFALLAVQTAIYQKLTTDAALTAKVTGVFDDVPDGQAFPYVQLGDATEEPFRTFKRDGSNSTFTVHVFSRYRGFMEAYEVAALVNAALDGATLNLGGFDPVSCYYEGSSTLTDPDGITRHIPIRFRIIVQEGANG